LYSDIEKFLSVWVLIMIYNLFYSFLFFVVLGSVNLSASDDQPFPGFRAQRTPLEEADSCSVKRMLLANRKVLLCDAVFNSDFPRTKDILRKYFKENNENFFLDSTPENPMNIAIKYANLAVVQALWMYQEKTPQYFSHLVNEGLEQEYAKKTINFPSPLHTAASFGRQFILQYLTKELQAININPQLILFFNKEDCHEFNYFETLSYEENSEYGCYLSDDDEKKAFGFDYIDYAFAYGTRCDQVIASCIESFYSFYEFDAKNSLTRYFSRLLDRYIVLKNPNVNNIGPLMDCIKPFDMDIIEYRFLEFLNSQDNPEFAARAFAYDLEIGIANEDMDFDEDNTVPPLQVAVTYGHYHTVKKLIEMGAALTRDDYCGDTLLHCAVTHLIRRPKDARTVELLLKMGLEVDAVNHSNETPLCSLSDCSIHKDMEQITHMFLDNGADINRPTYKGQYPIINFMFKLNKDAFKEILSKAKVNMSCIHKGHESPIHLMLSNFSMRRKWKKVEDQTHLLSTADQIENFKLLMNHESIDMTSQNEHGFSVEEVITNYVEEKKFYMGINPKYQGAVHDNRANRVSKDYKGSEEQLKCLQDVLLKQKAAS